MRLMKFALATVALTTSTVAFATSGGYDSGVNTGTINQTNFVHTSDDIPNGSGSHGSSLITAFNWSLGASTTSQGTLQSRICSQSGTCSPWSSARSGSLTVFNGRPASTVFHFELQVVSPTTVLLNPKVLSPSQSTIGVSYNF